MRVLWLSANSALFRDDHVNGGWIASLQTEIMKQKDITLGIAFPVDTPTKGIRKDGVSYYPVLFQSTKIKILRIIDMRMADSEILKGYINAIKDFAPDIIHVWGSEFEFGLVSKYTDIPIILHIQGLMNPIYNLRYPNNVTLFRIMLSSVPLLLKYYIFRDKMKHYAKRELQILRNIRYVYGRTEWDRNATLAINPQRKYFYCSELLRSSFWNSRKWTFRENAQKIVITSVINGALYKGGDVILRTAEILSDLKITFVWNVIGIKDLIVHEKLTGVKCKDVNINIMGRCQADKVVDTLLDSDVFVHTSYIENSPNCVCEAQLLGIPVIASCVGGTPTLIKDGVTGFLVGTNDAYNIAGLILRLKENKDICNTISKNEINVAEERHKITNIVSDLLDGYKYVLDSDKVCRQ